LHINPKDNKTKKERWPRRTGGAIALRSTIGLAIGAVLATLARLLLARLLLATTLLLLPGLLAAAALLLAALTRTRSVLLLLVRILLVGVIH
jgi:hypothetical protein